MELAKRLHLTEVLLCAFLALFSSSGTARAQAFTEVHTGLAAPPFPCVAWGDFDGDGDLDVLVAGLGKQDIAFTTLYRNSGGTFTDSGISLLGLSRASAAWGDFDGDGDLDLAMTGLTSAGVTTTRIYRSDGGTTFTPLASTLLGVFGGNVAWGDYDGDGDLDLLVTGVTSTVAGVGVAATRLYRNDAGVFTSVPHPFPNCYLGSVSWGDYDKDGRLDVVITGTTEVNALFAGIWHNQGGGAFADAGANLPGDDLGPAVWGDYDNDGDLDLLLGGNSNDGFITRLYRNDAGTFTDVNAGLLGLLWASAAWGDYDNDGDLDLMVEGYDAGPAVARSILYRNDAGTFVDSGNTFHNLYLGTLSWGDYDNDGDLDLLMAGNEVGADLVILDRNNSATANLAPAAPSGLAVHFVGTDTQFSWNAATDDHTPASGLGYNLRVGTSPGGSQIVSPHSAAGGYRRLPALGNAQSDLGSHVDSLQANTTYFWSVQSVDAALLGSPFAPEQSFSYSPTAVGGVPAAAMAIARVMPNPFFGGTTVHLTMPTPSPASLLVLDTAGRIVRRLWIAPGAGERTIGWDGRDGNGREAPAGIYPFRVEGGSTSVQGALVKIR